MIELTKDEAGILLGALELAIVREQEYATDDENLWLTNALLLRLKLRKKLGL